ncbi:MAG: AbrB/MazE/SpoVT family DNA-binding domain-containing protein [Vicinamibacterales bacterium]
MTTQLARWGNSLAFRLPKSVAMETKLAEGDSVEVSVKDGAIVLTPVARRLTIEELVKGITPENRHPEVDWGPPVGREEW